MKHLFLFLAIFMIGGLAACQPTERTFVRSTTALDLKWSFKAAERIRKPPLYLKNRVAIRTDSEMEGIESGSGIIVWNVRTGVEGRGEMSASPDGETLAFANNGVYDLVAVDAETGFVLWRRNGTVFSIALDEERVFVGRDRNSIPLEAYRLAEGESLWESGEDVPRGIGTHFLFAQKDRLIAFPGNDLYALDKETGKVQYSVTNFLQGGSKVKMVENQVYMWFDSKLQVKDALTGRVIWEADVDPWFYAIIGPRVIVGSANILTSLDNATGEILWQKKLGSKPIADPVAIGETGYMILDNASIIAFDLETGTDRGIIETSPAAVNPEGMSKGLATDGEALFATFGDNSLFAFGK